MSEWLAGKRALVVGAGSGIGRGVVDAFRSEGAQVAVLEKSEAKAEALASARPEVPVVVGDATRYDDDRRAVAATVEAFGGLDVLVSCVGIFDFYHGLDALDVDALDAAFDEIFAVNVKSHLYVVKAALPQLRAHRGAVVLTTSTSAYFPGRGGILYVSSKFAVRGIVTSLAHELAPEIRVNAVAPGGTLSTDLRGPASLGEDQRRLDDGPDRAPADLAARDPLNVALSPADHAWSYVFLASDRSRGITGDVTHPDGGIGIKG